MNSNSFHTHSSAMQTTAIQSNRQSVMSIFYCQSATNGLTSS